MRLLNHSAHTGHSELTLGHIIQQSAQGGAGHAQRGEWLGEGFYGFTEGWATVRAGEGLLLSTTPRSARGASVSSTQMDAQEAVGQLKASRQLGDALSQSARQQGALGLSSHDADQAMQLHANAVDPAAQGKYNGSINGQEAKKADQNGSRSLTDPVERFAKPLLHLDTPASAVWVTPTSISLFSGQDTSLTTQGDAHITSSHTLSSVSGQTTSLYTHSGGIKGITANGPLSLRAHTDAMQMWADKDITVQSTTNEIRIYAKDSIALNAGQSQLLLKGADITFTMPGQFTVKGSAHEWASGASGTACLPDLPEGAVHVPAATPVTAFSCEPDKYSERLAVFNPLTGEAQAIKYVLINKGMVVDKRKSGGDGFATRLIKPDQEPLEALVGSSAAWAVEYHAGEQSPIRIAPGDEPTMNPEDDQHV